MSFETTLADAVRLTIMRSKACPALTAFGVYLAPVVAGDPVISRDRQGLVSLCVEKGPSSHGVRLRYSQDGSTPTSASPVFDQPFPLKRGGVVTAVMLPEDNPDACVIGEGVPVTKQFGLAKTLWRVMECDSEETDGIMFDLGAEERLTAFSYLPRQDGIHSALVDRYAFYASRDGQKWGEPVSIGRFDNILANPVEQVIPFTSPVQARYIKFVSLGAIHNKPCASAAEINVFVQV